MFLGIDAGSVSLKAVLIDAEGHVIEQVYLRNRNIFATLREATATLADHPVAGVVVTGSGRELLHAVLGADLSVTEIVAHARASVHLRPDVRTVIDIGGEDSKLILVKNGRIIDFAMNTDCGGGTGALIEMVCTRLGVQLEDCGALALGSTTGLTLPSKCGVFCQSAVVSKKNMGIPARDILKAVIDGIVNNYVAMLMKAKTIAKPLMFQGACARNAAMVRAFENEFGEIIVPPGCAYMGALGGALIARERIAATRFTGFPERDPEVRTRNGKNCPNRCEIIDVIDAGRVIATFGNRCDRCRNTAA
ncbi:MAG: 2-hydroxyglutaryl-CoA dehydratase [Deltaproteobacteria bacterium]|nr:2-hydroxyglutaryl-CoA dehydratase [Candidatus Anaeroferrophillacea bacterium]